MTRSSSGSTTPSSAFAERMSRFLSRIIGRRRWLRLPREPDREKRDHFVLTAGAVQEQREDHQVEEAPLPAGRARLVERFNRNERGGARLFCSFLFVSQRIVD